MCPLSPKWHFKVLCKWSHTISEVILHVVRVLFVLLSPFSVARTPWCAPVSLLATPLWRTSCLTPVSPYYNTAATNIYARGFVGDPSSQGSRSQRWYGENTAQDLDQAVPAADACTELPGSSEVSVTCLTWWVGADCQGLHSISDGDLTG